MARKPRIEFPGAFYHVITRGNQQQNIFREDNDFLRYTDILSKYKKRFDFKLYAYVLMNNHVHLLMETQNFPLSKICQGINQSYTAWFNKKYRLSGHLFQGRYKAILCDQDSYLLSLLKYIHLNPVRAGMVKNVDEYRWSAHRVYMQGEQEKPLIDTNNLLGIFSRNKANAIKLYQAFMHEKETLEKKDVYRTIDQQILGGEDFLDEVMKRSNVGVARHRKMKEFDLKEIAGALKDAYDVSLKMLRGKGKSGMESKSKKLFTLIADEYGYSGRDISAFIEKDPSVISRYLKEKDILAREVEGIILVLEKAKDNRQA